MASIVESIVGDKALRLGGEEFVRKLEFGNAWNKLRVGMLCYINASADFSPYLYIGLCNGTTNTFSSASCDGWIGCRPGGYNYNWDGANNWFYYNGSTAPNFYYAKKLGSTVTDAGVSSDIGGYILAASKGRPHILFAEFVRTAGDKYTINWGFPGTSTQANQTVGKYEFYRVMESEYITGFVSDPYAGTYVRCRYIAGAQVIGLPSNMDTVSIYWSSAVNTLEIFDLSVIRFY